jgi:hypothetical protein
MIHPTRSPILSLRTWRRDMLTLWGTSCPPTAWRQEALPEMFLYLLEEALRLSGKELAGHPAPYAAWPEPSLTACRRLLRLRPGGWSEDPGAIGELYSLLRRWYGAADGCPPGVHYTPSALCRFLVQRLADTPGLHWLDPACGCGAFLQAIRQADPGAAGIEGWDLDGHALQVAVLVGGRDAGWTLHHTNSLGDPAGLPGEGRARFDRLVMNPPFLNGVEQDTQVSGERESLRQGFTTARGPFDLYILFVERALQLVRPGGRLGLVLPDKWLAAGYGRALRALLADRYSVEALYHAPGSGLFDSADVEALLLVLRLEPGGPPAQVCRLDPQLVCGPAHAVGQQEFRDLAEEGWGPLLHADRERWTAAAARPTLGSRGLLRASMTTGEYYKVKVDEHPGPGLPDIVLVNSGAIAPWRHTWGQVPQRFRGRKLLRPAPDPASLSPTRLAQLDQPRVLVANMSRRLEAVPVWHERLLGVVNVIQIFCRDRDECLVMAAWLNSNPINEWLGLWYDPLRLSGQLSLNRSLLDRLPAPPDQGPCRDRLLELGLALHTLHAAGPPDPREVEPLAQRLDACVRRELRLPDPKGGPATGKAAPA